MAYSSPKSVLLFVFHYSVHVSYAYQWARGSKLLAEDDASVIVGDRPSQVLEWRHHNYSKHPSDEAIVPKLRSSPMGLRPSGSATSSPPRERPGPYDYPHPHDRAQSPQHGAHDRGRKATSPGPKYEEAPGPHLKGNPGDERGKHRYDRARPRPHDHHDHHGAPRRHEVGPKRKPREAFFEPKGERNTSGKRAKLVDAKVTPEPTSVAAWLGNWSWVQPVLQKGKDVAQKKMEVAEEQLRPDPCEKNDLKPVKICSSQSTRTYQGQNDCESSYEWGASSFSSQAWGFIYHRCAKSFRGDSCVRSTLGMCTSETGPTWHTLRPDNPKFQALQEYFEETFEVHKSRDRVGTRLPKKTVISEIWRIDNPFIHQRYKDYRAKMQARMFTLTKAIYSANQDSELKQWREKLRPVVELDAGINEAMLFHGTSASAAKAIMEGGYDLDRAANGLFGPGIYLAEKSGKSDEYTGRKVSEFYCHIIVNRAVLGRWWEVHKEHRKGDKIMALTPSGHAMVQGKLTEKWYSSVLGQGTNYREFILFDEGAVYPEYLIQYRYALF